MHRPQSIVKESSTATVRGLRAPGSLTSSLWLSMWMHQSGHSLTQSMQEVQAAASSAMAPRA